MTARKEKKEQERREAAEREKKRLEAWGSGKE
jgi:hypothetical protein